MQSTTTTTATITKVSEATKLTTAFDKLTTAFDSPVRLRGVAQKLGPTPEHTTDAETRPASSPSPINIPPPSAPRRFAPQLVETTRRTRRDGDTSVRPTEKTDITPYTRHKYSNLRSRTKRRAAAKNIRARADAESSTSRQASEDDYLLELAARRAEREAALELFPNSRPREGGAAHFYFRDSDDDTTASESCVSLTRTALGGKKKAGSGRRRGAGVRRRKSTDLGWWHKVMQEHAEEKVRAWQDGRDSDDDRVVDVESDPEGADCMPEWICEVKGQGPLVIECRPPPPASPAQKEVAVVAETPLVAPKPRAAPKGILGGLVNADAENEVDMEYEAMRRAASPPMLGGDIVFPRCLSPETCKISTDLPFSLRESEEKRRDPTQKCGLWGGYCFKAPKEEPSPLLLDPNTMTPPSNGGSMWCAKAAAPPAGPCTGALSPPPTPPMSGMWSAATPQPQPAPSQGLNRFQKASAAPEKPTAPTKPALTPEEKERRISAEFTDAFVTQLYNYLSLGYPVTARAFDAELCAVTGMSEVDITGGDAKAMERGHMCNVDVERCPAERQCPRWKALKAYVLKWAEDQEDLDEVKVDFRAVGGRGSWRP
ncbi:uncharacterized protein DNG_07803 [Cephalotrichum gorgonifer]|uniref:Uncharacterized protein n=1 Tax=Cephalotrichum gorgonifer TaxID=2041049 RepID=A0AAE8N4A2_9PEZI|nr:uncharacterized protein DNG_07803 [Cephalotrichum gorgonifer]